MELTFDEMTMDTTLGQEYLKKFKQDGHYKLSKWYNGANYYEAHEFDKYVLKAFHVNQDKLYKLANILKEKINLLAQIEYLTLDIPIEDSKAQINIIIEQLKYVSYYKSLKVTYDENEAKNGAGFYENSPLLILGYVAKVLVSSKYFYIYAEKTRAAICILFTQLCHEADLPVFTKIYDDLSLSIIKGPCQNLPVGALGVVSEHSDVDSAVNMFLNSSKKAPWRLQRILVQESVSQQFKDAAAWKCERNESLNTLKYNGQVFYFDQIGIKDPPPGAVFIDTYRTTKELLTMLAEYPSYYLSLWANNIAEINEIIYSMQTPIVWVNNFAEFRGPSKITEVFYPHSKFGTKKCGFCKNEKLNELLKLKQSWLKLTVEARRDIICEILKSCELTEVNGIPSVMYCTNDSLVYVDKDFVCTGIPTASYKTFLLENADDIYKNVEFYESIVLGNAYIITLKHDDDWIEILKKLKEANVPVVRVDNDDLVPALDGLIFYKYDYKLPDQIARPLRMIWTNSGTIFAN